MDIYSAVQLTALFKTGDLHAAFYDFARDTVYITVAKYNSTAPESSIPAYDRAWVSFNAGDLFAQKINS